MVTGRLKSGFTEKGFTFIEPDDGSGDVFLHVSHIKPGEEKANFVRGATVEYDVELVLTKGQEKPQARSASILGVTQGVLQEASEIVRGQAGSVKFWHPSGYGFVIDSKSGEEHYTNSQSVVGGYLRSGDLITFDLEDQGDRTKAINVHVTGWGSIGDKFDDEIDMGNPNWSAQLAELAEKKESWNYKIKPSKDHFAILRSYIKYTYLRQRELSGHLVYSGDGQYMTFNTGLVSDFQEQIFAVFSKRAGSLGPEWKIHGFEKASSLNYLKRFGSIDPPLAWYYSKPEELVYDTNLDLRVNVEHVPHDKNRFPASLMHFSPEDLAGLVNAKAPEAIERVRRNYKTAIPQFYRDGNSGEGKMQLLLPVGLVRRDQVELALAVDRLDSGVYLGKTVLTLDWAYNNARLITRPDTDWLQP